MPNELATVVQWVPYNPAKKIAKLREEICCLQKGEQTVRAKEEILSLQKELEHIYMDEEIYWRQRCKNPWAQEGDRNTLYFHSKANRRQRKNKIPGLQNNLGEWCEKVEDVENIITRYFGELFQSSHPASDLMDEIWEDLAPVVTPAMNQQLTAPFVPPEVILALSQMSTLKSPGPDGLSAVFFQKYWHIIGTDICPCVLDFLNNNHLPRMLNFTFIVLIPKVPTPKRITEFCPISLCNVIYKLGSEVLANRVKPFLNDLISQTQSAFVPQRLITDNVLVAFEVNHFLKCRTRELDVSKAYDRIEWCFLLLKMGFHATFVNTIMLSITTLTYSCLPNGKQFGALQPARGLRQGDPLLPYLFICCAEVFIRMVEAAVAQGRLHGIRVAPIISNLCFADDTVLFCQASVAEAEAEEVVRILEKYAQASGQLINLEKSSMVFSPGTPSELRLAIQGVLGIQVVDKFEKYLGMPAVVGHSKKEVFSFLKD